MPAGKELRRETRNKEQGEARDKEQRPAPIETNSDASIAHPTDPLSLGERVRVRGEAPIITDATADVPNRGPASLEALPPEADAAGSVLREPQDERGLDPEAPSTPVARPLTLFDIPVFTIDPVPSIPSPSAPRPEPIEGGSVQGEGFTDAEAVACSLENPEYCEACQ